MPRPRFTPGKKAPGTHCIGGWVDPRTGLEAEARGKILRFRRKSNHGRPVSSQTLYWTNHPAHKFYIIEKPHLSLYITLVLEVVKVVPLDAMESLWVGGGVTATLP
jgi:hypothetical protein